MQELFQCKTGEDNKEKIIRISSGVHSRATYKSPESHSFLAYRHWSMKEAYGKALGIGMDFKMQQAEFHYQNGLWGDSAHVHIDGVYAAGWEFWLHKLGGNHWVRYSGLPSHHKTKPHNQTSHKSYP